MEIARWLTTKSLQPAPGNGSSSAARFTSLGPAWLNSGRWHRMRARVGILTLATLSLLFFGACTHQPARRQITFTGAVKAGERFQRSFGERFIFKLEPSDFGWIIALYEKGRNEDLSRLTPPFHFVPNSREIEGWHFRNEMNTGPNDGSVNAPQGEREFIFSPEVGRAIQGPTARWSVSTGEVERVSSFGRGVLHIEHLLLSPVKRGDRAKILEMDFKCMFSWPNQFGKLTITNQGAASNRRSAGRSDGSDNLSAILAADRAFPAAVVKGS